jgi:hypothetical protein
MNQQHNRPLLIFTLLETFRLQRPTLHTFTVCTPEPEVLSFRQVLPFQIISGESCDLLHRNTVRPFLGTQMFVQGR